MSVCFFVTDLHGHIERYEKLFAAIEKEKPAAVFMGGDLLPSGLFAFSSGPDVPEDFTEDFFFKRLIGLKQKIGNDYPRVFMILGNDDGKAIEQVFIEAGAEGILEYIHNRKVKFDKFDVYGYAYVPPTPFMLKDWEKYDVSRYVDPGCIPPEEGSFSVPVNKKFIPFQTIKKDLDQLGGEDDLSKSIFLFHTPPYKTKLDRAALDGKFYEHVPLDVHVGSIAVERFIRDRQPFLTMHGHIHESTSITGEWKDSLGKTVAFNGAHNGKELSLIRFDLDDLSVCSRELI